MKKKKCSHVWMFKKEYWLPFAEMPKYPFQKLLVKEYYCQKCLAETEKVKKFLGSATNSPETQQ